MATHRGEYEDRYRERYQTAEDRDRVSWRDADDGDRERRFGRFGRWDEDRGRDDDRPRYQGWGGQSGSQSGNMSDNRMRDDRMRDNMFREQTGYRGEDMYRRGQSDNGRGQWDRGPQDYGRGMHSNYGGREEWGRGQQGSSWGTGGQQGFDGGGMFGQQVSQYGQQGYGPSFYGPGFHDDRDFGGTLGHVDRSYGRERGAQYGTSGPFGGEGRYGGHRGKGPSGYVRSDERIREDIGDALTEDDYLDASGIEIQVKNGEVTLSGTVHDRRSKRMAEDVIERIPGIKDVTNHIRVQDREREMSGGGMGRTPSQSVSNSPEKDKEGDNGSRRPRA